VSANETPQVSPALNAEAINTLVEILNLLASARDAMSDEMVSRLAHTLSEGLMLLDRLTRNEGLMRLLCVLDRPEIQYLLVSLSHAILAMSRDLATVPPAKGGLLSLYRLARDPGTQEGLRALSLLGQYWNESLRELHRRGTSKMPPPCGPS
jgi:uncharacterized protein YjgD (DUF1641 family)